MDCLVCPHTASASKEAGLALLGSSHDWRIGEGGEFSMCTVVSGSKNERVVTLANSPLGLQRRLVDKELERVDTGGFGRLTSEMNWILLGRRNKRLLKLSTALGFFPSLEVGEGKVEKRFGRSRCFARKKERS